MPDSAEPTGGGKGHWERASRHGCGQVVKRFVAFAGDQVRQQHGAHRMRARASSSSQPVAGPSPVGLARGSRRQDRAREERPSHEVVASRGEAGAQPDQLLRRGDGCDGIVFSESARQGAGWPKGSLQGVVKAPANEQGAEPSGVSQGRKSVCDPAAMFFDDRTR
jgi:hypothetical protein